MKNNFIVLRLIGLCFTFWCFALSLPAQSKDLRTLRDDRQSDGYVGVALVIGNSLYQYATVLNSPANDANDIARVFNDLGFKVLKVRANADLSEMESAIAELERELSANQGVGIFYYSGHGVQSKGLNYLIPVDANIPTEAFLKQKAIDLESVMGTMEEATNKAKIVILDACRNDPFKDWRNKGNGEKGLAKVDAPNGMLIAFATSPKRTAADGLGRNSPYTEILLQNIIKPNISIMDMLQNVRSDLLKKYSQTSWENTSLLSRFCFAGCDNSSTSGSDSTVTNPNWIKEAQRYFNLGLECGNTEYDCKITNYSKAIELNPNDSAAYNRRGNAYFYKKEYDQAILDYNQAVKISPNDAKAYSNRAFYYIFTQKFDLAIEDCDRAIKLHLNFAEAYYHRGIAYHYKQNYNQAIQDFTEAIKINPNNAVFHRNRAISYDKAGEASKAQADRKRAEELEIK